MQNQQRGFIAVKMASKALPGKASAQVTKPNLTTFGQLGVGDKFRIAPTPGCPKGQCPLHEKIQPEKDKMYPEDLGFNCQVFLENAKITKTFLYDALPVIRVI